MREQDRLLRYPHTVSKQLLTGLERSCKSASREALDNIGAAVQGHSVCVTLAAHDAA